jgi:5-methylcytosine-specific restriction protein A
MAMRAFILAENPLCVLCQKKGKRSASVEVDHIIPLHQGGADDQSNMQALCLDCHKAKTKREFSKKIEPHESWG